MRPTRFLIAIAGLAAAVSSPQAGTDLPQVHDSTAGVPLAQLFASLDMLGQWLLPSGPRLQVMSFMTKNGGECTETDQNPDNCPHYALIVSLFDWPSSLIDPALFRGPERLAWKMMSDRPKKLRDVKDGSEYSLDILACETSPYISRTGTGNMTGMACDTSSTSASVCSRTGKPVTRTGITR
jgi:hypothetical protein